jgi:hypothetical protein
MGAESEAEMGVQRVESPPGRRRVMFAIGAGVLVFAVVAVAVWWERRPDDTTSSTTALTATSAAPSGVNGGVATGVPAEIVTVAQLQALARATGHPLYWAGARQGTRLEYTQTPDGSTYIRYLTGTARAGSKSGDFIVVATYPQPNALGRVSKIAGRQHLKVTHLPGGGIAVTRTGRPQNVYIVYPDQPYQVEVYAPNQATSRRLVFDGRVRPVG